MAEIVTQGVDIQLKILQALLSLVTSLPDIHGNTLGDVRTFEEEIGVIYSLNLTGAPTLLQVARVTDYCCLIDSCCDFATTCNVRLRESSQREGASLTGIYEESAPCQYPSLDYADRS
jgi:Dimerisation and cyclophilin-binding domain of Mon2